VLLHSEHLTINTEEPLDSAMSIRNCKILRASYSLYNRQCTRSCFFFTASLQTCTWV